MREDSITLGVFEKYNPEELTTIAAQLAQAVSDRETVKAEKKVSDGVFNGRITECETAIQDLAKRYNKGGETAQIGCDIRYDNPEPGKKSYFRMDRNELVETHDMTWEEKQETIQFPLAQIEAESTDAEVDQGLDDLEMKLGEEVTRLCPFPGCTGFQDHEGDHIPAEPDVTTEQAPKTPLWKRVKNELRDSLGR